jgi:hypothetical protein
MRATKKALAATIAGVALAASVVVNALKPSGPCVGRLYSGPRELCMRGNRPAKMWEVFPASEAQGQECRPVACDWRPP